MNHGPGRVGVLEQCPEREPVGVLGRPGTLGRAGNPDTLEDTREPEDRIVDAFHPEASENFNGKAAALVGDLPEDVIRPQSGVETFQPDLPISGHLTADDIVGVSTQTLPDADGHEIARALFSSEGAIRLDGATHDRFMALVRAIHSTKFMRESVSFDSVADWVGGWLLAAKLGHDVGDVCSHVSRLRAETVREFRVIVPLCEPYIESRFNVGESLVRPLTRDEVAGYFKLPPDTPEETRAAGETVMKARRKLWQARTAVVIDVTAEAQHAFEVAWDRANIVAAMLRLFSKGIFFPTTPSNCVPLGLARQPKRIAIAVHPDDGVAYNEMFTSPDVLENWRLSDGMIQQDLPYLTALARLQDSPRPTPFQQDLLKAVLLYSRAALSEEVTEKLIHIFAALESLLLKSDSEPVQSALSERVAFVIGDSADAREAIAQSVKRVYAHRSKFVHHGLAPERRKDLEEVKQLQLHVWKFFVQVVMAQDKYEGKTDFLRSIEKRKWQ